MDDDIDLQSAAERYQAEHSSFSADTRCYHFASQSLFLSNGGPSHFGLVGGPDDDRIYLVYEQQAKLEIFRYMKKQQQQQSKETEEEFVDENGDHLLEDREQFRLERTVPLYQDAVDIGQVVYSHLAPEFFVLLAKGGPVNVNGSSQEQQPQQRYCMRSLKVYTNYMDNVDSSPCTAAAAAEEDTTTTTTTTSVKLRGSGELLAALSANSDSSSSSSDISFPPHLTNLSNYLNLIDLKHADISTLAHHVALCPVAGHLLISTANGSMLLYRRHRLRAPQSSEPNFVTLDFLLIKSITILDSWTPEVVRLSLDYVAFMCPTHFSLIQIVLDSKQKKKKRGKKNLKSDPPSHAVAHLNGSGKSGKSGSGTRRQLPPHAHLIYNRLFDEPAPAEVTAFLQTPQPSRFGGPGGGGVGYGLGCKFAIYDYTTDHRSRKTTTTTTTSSSTYRLLFCRHLSLPPRQQPSAARGLLRTKGTRENGNYHQQQPKAVPNELRRIAAKNSLVVISEQQCSESNFFLYGFELVPYRDRAGRVFAHALYILSAGQQQLDCYLVDLRRDHLRLVPISRLSFGPQPFPPPPPLPQSTSTPPPPSSSSWKLVKTFPSMTSLASTTLTAGSTIKNLNHTISAVSATSTARVLDFTVNPQEDLVHVLLDSGYLDSYATQIFPFLVSDQQTVENLYCSRPIAPMYRISGNLFLNVIAALSSPRFVYLLSGAVEGGSSSSSDNFGDHHKGKEQQQTARRHTIYYLERPSIDHLQADILSALDDLKSSSDELAALMGGVTGAAFRSVHDRHSFHRLYCRVLAIIKFALNYPMRSIAAKEEEEEEEEEEKEEEICLQALYEKVEAEIAEIIAEGASCTDPNCLFARS
ncbi:hypothetical protein TYRP_009841 [Tyrophagus putrescentiae]|nr:hypothetical protein TYRP_009841 [Tyrophagus putrescentiae]